MLSILVSLLILLVIFSVAWWILSMIPVPPQFRWLVNVIVAVCFLIALISLLTGGYSIGHPILR